MDLVGEFDVRAQRLHVLSYEEDKEVAERSRTCPGQIECES
jgi:hypothetical protein